MQNKFSNWVRQVRHRAKKYKCVNRLTLDDVTGLFEVFNGRCAYCAVEATAIDQPFLISDNAPNVVANCLPVCKRCKEAKKNVDLIAYHLDGKLSRERLVELLEGMLARDGGPELRVYMKRITGFLVD